MSGRGRGGGRRLVVQNWGNLGVGGCLPAHTLRRAVLWQEYRGEGGAVSDLFKTGGREPPGAGSLQGGGRGRKAELGSVGAGEGQVACGAGRRGRPGVVKTRGGGTWARRRAAGAAAGLPRTGVGARRQAAHEAQRAAARRRITTAGRSAAAGRLQRRSSYQSSCRPCAER